MAKLDLVGTTEIRMRLGVSKTRIKQLVGSKGFPDPVAVVSGIRIWERATVEAWIAKNRPDLDQPAS